ncbi:MULTISPECIES: GNAT family N-acetyltransferase [unclassified Rhodococcus (in: high G+C Gram-positive bacteria)]|uniref:GNAT family N-acetyltransferase n=1 Tax=unclassified Rhodococcus (in: high G+C Gram-positive bacteria) TaxID=192944 RepID=UPI00163A2F3E|nr:MULTISPECIES: GNAT family N-acetyltransferase [unclassified Rhodococcus (in: high G+C Gram-positive bacteria)]MBC2643243.1 GNAT family N-acetyltransferase [Rhodococcus sp. 3A]MBC2892016.1 GNAT family N-acetyltransferase [Rhodococcus sp. 4CII]
MGCVDSHHLDIVRLAWSRELGLPDDALATRPDADDRAVRVDDETDTIRFLRLGEASALVGPRWAIERADAHTSGELAESATLLALTQDRSGRCAGPMVLAFATDYQDPATGTPPLVSHEYDHVRHVEAASPPDDVTEARLGDRDRWFTILDDAQQPVASAGYAEFQGFLADVGVLTVPAFRRRGLGATVAGIATDDALDSGLIAQCRSPRDNLASRALAARAGYRELGTYSAVTLSRSTL